MLFTKYYQYISYSFVAILYLFTFPPFGLWQLGFVVFPALYFLIKKSTSLLPISYFGMLFSILAYYWIFNAVYIFSNSIILGILALIGFSLVMASFFVILQVIFKFTIKKTPNKYLEPLIFAILFYLVFFIKHLLMPWYGISVMFYKNLYILNAIKVFSIYGFEALALIFFTLPIYFFLIKKNIRYVFLLSVFLPLIFYFIGKAQMSNKVIKLNLSIDVMQPNILQRDKMNPHKWQMITYKTLNMIKQSNADLIILPESAFNYVISQNSPLIKIIQDTLKDNQYLMTGALHQDGSKIYNSVFLINKKRGIIDIYNKIDLVPFGEYIPFLNNSLVKNFGFTKGKDNKLFYIFNTSFSPSICYEIATNANQVSHRNSNFIINLTNDAWYKHSTAIYHHLALAQIKAIRYNKPLLRSANTGISAYINQNGQIIKYLGYRNYNFFSVK